MKARVLISKFTSFRLDTDLAGLMRYRLLMRTVNECFKTLELINSKSKKRLTSYFKSGILNMEAHPNMPFINKITDEEEKI